MRLRTLILAVVFASALGGLASLAYADPRPLDLMDAAGIKLALEKLNVVGSALYVAAHPDDENTAMIAWLSRGRKVRAAYLSMTRGDGGQNLIGSDVGERLGVIRTQELLGARRIDGGEQFFTRALDFGYSKNPEETLEIWDRERILADVVWVIRRYRPDIIVTRFHADSSSGHGHHTASAMLAEAAFETAADPTRFPEQLRLVRPWRATRLVWNVFRFGAAGPDTSMKRLRVDLGAYDPVLGRSYTEIAGESRSMHKSQGFGSAERRGEWLNTLEHRLGERASKDLFDGVDLTWKRIPGGGRLTPLFERAAVEFRPERPEGILPLLLQAWDILYALPEEPLVAKKRLELAEVVRSCAGLWVEAIAAAPVVSPGSTVRVVASALMRRDAGLALERVEILNADRPNAASVKAAPSGNMATRVLPLNRAIADTFVVPVSGALSTSGPYWLHDRSRRGSAGVEDQELIGIPENAPVLTARFTIRSGPRRLTLDVPIVYRWIDPVQGERYRDLTVVPPVTLGFDQPAYLFPDLEPREIQVNVRSSERPIEGSVRLGLPAGWRSSPAEAAVRLRGGDADTTVRFRVTPAASPAAATVAAEFMLGGRAHGREFVRLDYPHIPIQTLLPQAEAHLVRTDLRKAGTRVGYVMGSGDQVPDALRQMGFAVTLLSDEDLEVDDLAPFTAIVVGVRAYNTRPRLRALQRRLLDYVGSGGRLVVQYNTADAGLDDRLGPYPFKISRDRVTVEEAPVRLLEPAHALMMTPNRITVVDMEGWVQERGLYFANPWDPRYETVLSCNDPGEPARDGGILYARHGKGDFIYTGFAWFRQLPAGVPGAYRLFANLVSSGR